MAPILGGGPAGCPVAEILDAGASTLGRPELRRAADHLAAPFRVQVDGRPGAGRSIVARALHVAGVSVVGRDETPDIVVYVFVETLTPEDRDALSAIGQPCVAVLNKADLAGFGGPGPMVTAGARCRALGSTIAVPIVPVAALLVRTSLDDAVFDGLAALAGGGTVPGGMPVKALLAELDLFGIAVAVEALRFGAGREALAAELRRVSGIEELIGALQRTAVEARYRRAAAELAVLAGRAADPGGRRIAEFLSGDALVLARMASATAVLQAAGLSVSPGATRVDCLQAAVAWLRYARGPVSDLHRACGADIARGALRLWARVPDGPESGHPRQ
ncbi:MAG: hypothetical protein KDB71_00455 [Mycobacterium sp.]|nr:hypothetical protein [Mycobacterium sp.]